MSDQITILQIDGIAFSYSGNQEVLRGVSLTASKGQLTCLLGPNGSGKTTLLRCLLGLLSPQRGQILLDGRLVSEYSTRKLAQKVAYVPQFPQSAFAFTARELVLMGRYSHTGLLGIAGKKDLDIVREAMKMTDTDTYAQRTLSELSGGEAQRVMIARALAQQPQVMLLDEPTSHLDIRNQLMIYRMMRRLAHDWGMTVICVSHEVNMAARFADQLVLMRKGEILAHGSSREVINEAILREVYEVDIELIAANNRDPDTPPIVLAH